MGARLDDDMVSIAYVALAFRVRRFTDNDDGEDSSYTGQINPAPGAIVQVFLVTAQSESSRGAKRIVQSAVVTDPLVF